MVKNIVLEAPKSPQSKPPLLVPPVKKFFTSRGFRASKLMLKKYRDKLCLGTFVIVDASHLLLWFWLMQVYKPYSCVLRRK